MELVAGEGVDGGERLIEEEQVAARQEGAGEATRWRWPPESRATRTPARSARRARAPRAAPRRPPLPRGGRVRRSARGGRHCRRRWPTAIRPSRCGMSALGAAATAPVLGASRPASTCSRVVLPTPLRPTIATVSPRATRRSTLASSVRPAPSPSRRRARPPRVATGRSGAAASGAVGAGPGAGSSTTVKVGASYAGVSPQVQRVGATCALSAARCGSLLARPTTPSWSASGQTTPRRAGARAPSGRRRSRNGASRTIGRSARSPSRRSSSRARARG